MLEMIEQDANKISNSKQGFKSWYWYYCYDMQKRAIDQEIAYLLKYNRLDILSLDRLIQNYLEKLVDMT